MEETIKKLLGAMTVNEMINGYYVRFRKSKSNKAMLDDIFKFEDIMEEDGWKRIGTYEVRLTDEAVKELYERHMKKLFSRSV